MAYTSPSFIWVRAKQILANCQSIPLGINPADGKAYPLAVSAAGVLSVAATSATPSSAVLTVPTPTTAASGTAVPAGAKYAFVQVDSDFVGSIGGVICTAGAQLGVNFPPLGDGKPYPAITFTRSAGGIIGGTIAT